MFNSHIYKRNAVTLISSIAAADRMQDNNTIRPTLSSRNGVQITDDECVNAKQLYALFTEYL